MTEASPGTHQLMPSLEIEGEGSVGQLFPDMEARIVNLEGKDVGNDEEGEVNRSLDRVLCVPTKRLRCRLCSADQTSAGVSTYPLLELTFANKDNARLYQ